MPSRRVVLQLVVAFGVILPLGSPTDPSDYIATDPVNPTANFTTDGNATDSPDIIHQEFGPRANTDGPVVSTVRTPITQTVQAFDGTQTGEVCVGGTDSHPGLDSSSSSHCGFKHVCCSLACVCDVTPDFCDIGCCCDVVDCGVADLSSVFNNCRQEARAGVCIESWLMFRANVDPQLVSDSGSLFCVQRGNDISMLTTPEGSAPAAPEGSASISSPHFSLAEISSTRQSSVYKADDVILTYYSASSVVSVLRQPSGGVVSSSCVERNPAKFLRSGSVSCSRVVSFESCRRDSGLSSSSYLTGFSLLRVPRRSGTDVSKITIPVTALVDPPQLAELNAVCINVVTKVEYVITYTGAGEITAATLNLTVTNASFGTQILQEHAVQFQLATPSSPPPSPPALPLVGLEVGTPVIGWFGGQTRPLTMAGFSLGGQCTADLSARTPVLFAHNTISGCTFRSMLQDCVSLRAQIYSVLRGTATPDTVAMTAGSRPPQSRVVLQECPEPAPGEVCETGCLVPVSLSLRFLWAQRGLLALPQNHILGVKYTFSCQILKCPVISRLPLTTEVVFSDTTVSPSPLPRAKPRPEWKFPFGFFSRGAEELDMIQ